MNSEKEYLCSSTPKATTTEQKQDSASPINQAPKIDTDTSAVSSFSNDPTYTASVNLNISNADKSTSSSSSTTDTSQPEDNMTAGFDVDFSSFNEDLPQIPQYQESVQAQQLECGEKKKNERNEVPEHVHEIDEEAVPSILTSEKVLQPESEPKSESAMAASDDYSYSQQGSHLRDTVQSVFSKIRTFYEILGYSNTHCGNKRKKRAQDHRQEFSHDNKRKKVVEDSSTDESQLKELLTEKSSACVLFQQKLNIYDKKVESLETKQKSLTSSLTQTKHQLNKSNEALRIACQNLRNAQQDSRSLEEKCHSLFKTLTHIKQNLVEKEIHMSMERIQQEHLDITQIARNAEAQLIHTQADLTRHKTLVNKLTEQKSDIQSQMSLLSTQNSSLKQAHDALNSQNTQLQKTIQANKELEQARITHITKLEQELRDTQTFLNSTTSTRDTNNAEESSNNSNINGQSLLSNKLKQSILDLQNENNDLHTQISQLLSKHSSESKTQHSIQLQTEKELQSLKMEYLSLKEQHSKIQLDYKELKDKHVQQLMQKISSLENRLMTHNHQQEQEVIKPIEGENYTRKMNKENEDDQNNVSIMNRGGFHRSKEMTTMSATSTETKRKKPFSSLSLWSSSSPPPRANSSLSTTSNSFSSLYNNNNNKYSHKRNTTTVKAASSSNTQHTTCAICFKPLFGLYKSCQCNDLNCKKKAHAFCIHNMKSSFSSSTKPIVFCGNGNKSIQEEKD